MSFVEWVLKSSVALALALLGARFVGRRHPEAAHLGLALALAAVLVLPFVSRAVPEWRVAVARPAPMISPPPPKVEEPEIPPAVMGDISARRHESIRRLQGSPVPAVATSSSVPLLLLVWTVGAGLIVLRAAVGARRLNALRRGSLPLAPSPSLPGLDRPWELRRLPPDGPGGAFTFGLFKPVVLVPAASARWTPAQWESVLRHELAHARRADAAFALLAEAVCALQWFNPLAWLAARALRDAAERTADRAVIRGGVHPADYAAQLLSLAAQGRPVRLPLVQAMNSPKIESRIRAVLAARPSSSVLPTLGVAGLALLAVPALAALRPGQAPRSPEERTETLKRMKAVAIGTVLYAQDYDERLPYANSTAAAAKKVLPYARGGTRKGNLNVSDDELFRSATPGGRFYFNTKLSGLPFNQIAEPAGTLARYETVPDASAQVALAYADGHVKMERPERREALRAMRVAVTAPRRDPRIARRVPQVQRAETELRLIEAQDRLRKAEIEMERVRRAMAAAQADRARAEVAKARSHSTSDRTRLAQQEAELARRMALRAEADRRAVRQVQKVRATSLAAQERLAVLQAQLAALDARAKVTERERRLVEAERQRIQEMANKARADARRARP